MYLEGRRMKKTIIYLKNTAGSPAELISKGVRVAPALRDFFFMGTGLFPCDGWIF